MANHKSAEKRIRQNSKRRLANRYYNKTSRNLIRDLRSTEKQEEAKKALPKVVSLIDKLVKRGNIHKNKASNLKSKLTRMVSAKKK